MDPPLAGACPPLKGCEFAADFRKNGMFCRADRGVRPYKDVGRSAAAEKLPRTGWCAAGEDGCNHAFFFSMARMTNRTATIRAKLTSQVMYTFCTKPATMKPTKLTMATVTA